MTTIATCPNCASPSVQGIEVSSSDIPAAILTEYVLGPAAGITAGRKKVLQNYCVNCGARWLPGTSQEREMRVLSGQMGEQAKNDYLLARQKEFNALNQSRWTGKTRKVLIAGIVAFLTIVVLAAIRGVR